MNKPRRDITLGEMQDECSGRLEICAPDVQGNGECKYFNVCKQMRHGVNLRKSPQEWDLSDPPRFTEAQMALLKGLYACGCVTLIQDDGSTAAQSKDGDAMWFGKMLNLKSTETLDLAELLGKDGAEC